jgi:hypothetical protein
VVFRAFEYKDFNYPDGKAIQSVENLAKQELDTKPHTQPLIVTIAKIIRLLLPVNAGTTKFISFGNGTQIPKSHFPAFGSIHHICDFKMEPRAHERQIDVS